MSQSFIDRVMQVQSCCFANLNLSGVIFLPYCHPEIWLPRKLDATLLFSVYYNEIKLLNEALGLTGYRFTLLLELGNAVPSFWPPFCRNLVDQMKSDFNL